MQPNGRMRVVPFAMLLGRALGQGGGDLSCALTCSAVSYPSVRRSGTQPDYTTTWPGYGSLTYVSQRLEDVSIIRSTHVDPSHNTYFRGVSNATLPMSYKRDYLEVNDVVSFDVVLETHAYGVGLAGVVSAMAAGSRIYVKLGCSSSVCHSWAGIAYPTLPYPTIPYHTIPYHTIT